MSKNYGRLANKSEYSTTGILIAALVIVLLRGWALMVALGMIAGWAGIAGLAVGFWPALALATLIRIALNLDLNTNDNK